VTAIKKDLLIEQGTTFNWFFRLLNTDDSPVNLTAWEVRMQIRARQQATVQVDMDSATAEDITLGVDPDNFDTTSVTPDKTNGWVWVRIGADKTDDITVKSAVYDVELYDPDDPTTVIRLWQGGTTDDPNITQTPGQVIPT
jgi:hypothetical protein